MLVAVDDVIEWCPDSLRSCCVSVWLPFAVYDVTKGYRHYAPKGPYNHFAGKDATRAVLTGCFVVQSNHGLVVLWFCFCFCFCLLFLFRGVCVCV